MSKGTSKLHRSARRTLAIVLFTSMVWVLTGANTARAAIMGQVWEGIPNAGNAADPANRASSLANALFTSTAINYCSGVSDATCTSAAYTVAGFLNSPTFTSPMNGFTATGAADNIEVELKGSIFLTGLADSFNIAHDDGLTIALSGGPGTVNCSTQSGTLCLNVPGPTSPSVTPFTITASVAGIYNFTLDYSECCGPPAALEWTFPSGVPVGDVPEPSTWGMLATGLLVLGRLAKSKLMS